MSDWRTELDDILGTYERKTRAEQEAARFKEFLVHTVLPAFQELNEALQKKQRKAVIRETPAAAIITVSAGAVEEITFKVLRRDKPDAIIPYAEASMRERKGQKIVTSQVLFRDDSAPYELEDITKEEILCGFLAAYRKVFED